MITPRDAQGGAGNSDLKRSGPYPAGESGSRWFSMSKVVTTAFLVPLLRNR